MIDDTIQTTKYLRNTTGYNIKKVSGKKTAMFHTQITMAKKHGPICRKKQSPEDILHYEMVRSFSAENNDLVIRIIYSISNRICLDHESEAYQLIGTTTVRVWIN